MKITISIAYTPSVSEETPEPKETKMVSTTDIDKDFPSDIFAKAIIKIINRITDGPAPNPFPYGFPGEQYEQGPIVGQEFVKE